jgi:hypothetical protein
MIGSLPTFGVVAGVFLAATLLAWLLLAIIWYIVKRLGRATGVDTKVDQFLGTDGADLSDEERVKHLGGFRHGSGGA